MTIITRVFINFIMSIIFLNVFMIVITTACKSIRNHTRLHSVIVLAIVHIHLNINHNCNQLHMWCNRPMFDQSIMDITEN